MIRSYLVLLFVALGNVPAYLMALARMPAEAVRVATCLGCRVSLALCGVLGLKVEASGFQARLGASGRPVVVVSNHASMLDTPLLSALLPASQVRRLRMLGTSRVLRMPMVDRVFLGCRHMPIRFVEGKATGTEGAVSELLEHARGGGTSAWFPEGDWNRGDVRRVGLFRAGAFSVPSAVDCELWAVALLGTAEVWPPGGLPAPGASVVRARLELVCASACEGLEGRARCLHLAALAQASTQRQLDALVSREAS